MLQFNKLFNSHTIEMNNINKIRYWWIISSLMVYATIISIIVGWSWLIDMQHPQLWINIAIISLISINWWYWTMVIIMKLISHQQREAEFANELIQEIKELRKHIVDIKYQ